MGLIHWWPLNGNTQDYGSKPISLKRYDSSAISSSDFTDGKIGKCFITTSTASKFLTANNVMNNSTELSIACWCKTSTSGQMMWSFTSSVEGGIDMYMASYYSCNSHGDGSGNAYKDTNGNPKNVITDNAWHHFVTTFSSNVGAKLYIDGLYFGQAPTFRNPTSTNGTFAIGAYMYDFYRIAAHFNDVRIYDHCLTPLEVAEIARAKILHYPLDNNGWGARLPSGYQLVEYLESTGTLCLDSNVLFDSNEMTTTITFMQPTLTSGQSLYGASNSNVNWTGVPHTASAGTVTLYTASTGGLAGKSFTNNSINKYISVVNKSAHSFSVDMNGSAESGSFSGTPASNVSMGIFNLKMGTGNYTLLFVGKLYGFDLKKDNVVAFHGIPCYRKSDGKPGLYDLVSNTFLTNSGSGEFLLGPSVGLPADYLLVEYIETINTESTGFQYVSLNTTWALAKTIQQIAEVVKYSNGNHCMLYRNNALTSLWFSLDSTNSYLKGGSTGITLTSTALTWLNNKVYVSMTATSTSTYKFEVGAWSDVTWSGAWRNYSTRIFNTAAVCDLIPCYRKSDGKPGMYDVINGTFYTNSGSGEFLLGPSVGLPSRYRQCEYLQSSNSENATYFTIRYNAPSNISTANSRIQLKMCWLSYMENSASAWQDIVGAYDEVSQISNILPRDTSTTVNTIVTTTHTIGNNNTSKYLDFAFFGHAAVWPSRYAHAKVWYFRCVKTSRGTLFDLIPAYDTQTKQYGMFDIVNQKFYTNAGTGSFTAGPFTGFTECVYPPIAQRTTEYDISGYGRNGTYNSVDGRLFSSNSSRYSSSTEFQDNNTSINIGNLSTMVPEGNFTFNIWFYKSSLGDAYDTIFGGPSGFELETRAGGTGTEPKIEIHSWNNTTFDYQWNTWHMLTMVRTTSETLWYLDGLHQITGSAGTIPSGDYFIGAWRSATELNYKGKIADARIYATALSADDVMKLYHCEI